MLSRGGELMAGHPYCQAWLGAEGLPLRREASQNPAMLQGKDRFFGGVLRLWQSPSSSMSPSQGRDFPIFRRGKRNLGRAGVLHISVADQRCNLPDRPLRGTELEGET